METSANPKQNRPSRSIARQLENARLATTNSISNTEIAALLLPYGYDAPEIKHGNDLYKAAVIAVTGKTDLHGQQHYSTEQIEVLEDKARAAFQGLSQIARAIFHGQQSRLNSLGLDGPMPDDRAEFIIAAEKLFTTAQNNPDIAARLARRGYPATRIISEYEHITAFKESISIQTDAKGTAQSSTEDQATALATLATWLREFRRVARVALKGRPQLLEALGITTRRTKHPAAAPTSPAPANPEPNSPPLTPSA